MRCLSWICRDYFISLFFPLATKLIGPETGCQFFKNVDFFDNHPLKDSLFNHFFLEKDAFATVIYKKKIPSIDLNKSLKKYKESRPWYALSEKLPPKGGKGRESVLGGKDFGSFFFPPVFGWAMLS